MSMWTKRDKMYMDEHGLSHPKTNQQPLGNKNVLSVIVNYKYWSVPCCSLLIMLNGLPLTIMKPLTLNVSVFMCTCMCVQDRESEWKEGARDSMAAYLRKYRVFMALQAPVPYSIGLAYSQTSNLSAILFQTYLTKMKTAHRQRKE